MRRTWGFIRLHPIVTTAAACITLAAIGSSVQQFQSTTGGIAADRRGDARQSAGQSATPFICASTEEAPATYYNPQSWNLTYNATVAGERTSQLRYGVNAAESPQPGAPKASTDTQRKVVRRVTLQFSTPDVRAAYLRAAHVVSEARGEFVQDSGLTGTGNQMQGNLTLRIAVDRLGEVLDQLRGLGKVESEQANGEDVTEQVVDLEARLVNERRVETELQKLLESRQDAPLNEILQVRDKLSEVRGSIEQLTAQRDKLGRLVGLATVLVIIRAADAPPAPAAAPPTIGEYFVKTLSAAWSRSLRVLADTVALIVGTLIGGLVWWTMLVVVLVVGLRLRRRNRA